MRSSLTLAPGPGPVQGAPRAAAWLLAGLLSLALPATAQEAAPGAAPFGQVRAAPQVFGPDGAAARELPAETLPVVPRRRLDVRAASMTSMALSWAAPGDLARVAVTLDNVGRQRVTLYWALAAPGARRVLIEQPLELAFVPTVVTRHGPRDDRLYMAGWLLDERRLLLEEWTLAPVKLSAAPGADGVVRTLPEPLLPQVRRRQLYEGHRFDGLSPLSGLACDPDGGRLLLLPEGPAAGLAVLDLARGRLTPAEDLAALAGLELHCRWIAVGRHRWEGNVFVLQSRLPWEPRPAGAQADDVLVLLDADRDGAVDRVERLAAARFGEAFPPDGWLAGPADPPPQP